MNSIARWAAGITLVALLAGCNRAKEEEIARAQPEETPVFEGSVKSESAMPPDEGQAIVEEMPVPEPTIKEDRALLEAETSVESGTAVQPTGSSPADFKGYEAWFERYGLDLNDPKMLDDDPDGDGYSNRDEFLVDTDPKDSQSHPGFHPVMRLREFHPVEVPIVLEKVNGQKATLVNQSSGETVTVSPGEMIPDTSFKVKRVVSQIESDKFGETTDVSRLVAENTETGETVTFIKGMNPRSPESYAMLTSAKDPSVAVKVKQGEEFDWAGPPHARFLVVDLRPDQVVLKQLDTGEVWTVSMERKAP